MQLSGPDSAPGVCQRRDEQGSSCFLDVYVLAKHVLHPAGGGQCACGNPVVGMNEVPGLPSLGLLLKSVLSNNFP